MCERNIIVEDNNKAAYSFSDFEKQIMKKLTMAVMIQSENDMSLTVAAMREYIAGNLRVTLKMPGAKAALAAVHCVNIIKEERRIDGV